MAQLVKNLPAMWETWVWSLGWEDPLEKGKATHTSILAWKFHGQSTGSHSRTWWSDFHFSLLLRVGWFCLPGTEIKNSLMQLDPWVGKIRGEGNGYPFQYSGLDNSINRGIWQATVHGVAKSLTRLTEQLSLTKIEVSLWGMLMWYYESLKVMNDEILKSRVDLMALKWVVSSGKVRISFWLKQEDFALMCKGMWESPRISC